MRIYRRFQNKKRNLRWNRKKDSRIFRSVFNKLEQAEFLFDKKSSEEITNLAGKLLYILVDIKRDINHDTKVKEYIKQAETVEQKVLPKLRKQLKLK